jgi:hypothetical protein
MSYCRITINSNQVGLKFTHQSNKWFMLALFENGEAYSDGNGFSDLGWAKLLHCAYRFNCSVKEEKAALTVEDFFNFIEGLNDNPTGKEEFLEAVKVWSETQSTQELVKKVNDLTGEKPKRSKKK